MTDLSQTQLLNKNIKIRSKSVKVAQRAREVKKKLIFDISF